MIITKHGVMRFKKRQKIKNNAEMERKAAHAVERGRLVKSENSSAKTTCFLFDGFYYIVAGNNNRLVTVYRQRKHQYMGKKKILETIRIRELIRESRYSAASI